MTHETHDFSTMEPGDERRWFGLMEEQQRIHLLHEQRITEQGTLIQQVDHRLTIVEVGQSTMEKALEKLMTALEIQARQGTLNEAAIVAIRDRTDEHNRHIEEMKRDQVDIGKVQAGISIRINVIWGGLAVIATSLAGVVITHFLHF